tara:strand:- start:108 stop:620 length:513 start_codon:yes stop_codon:yes gene_type:complete
MIEKYLRNLPENVKLQILERVNNDKNFEDFLNNCCNLQINIFDDKHNIYPKNTLETKFSDLKVYYIKKFGYKCYNNFCDSINSIEIIEINLKKLKSRISLIDKILKYLTEDNNSFKINYSEINDNDFDYIEFDKNLFILSDGDKLDIIDSLSELNVDNNNNSPYIAEYSN